MNHHLLDRVRQRQQDRRAWPHTRPNPYLLSAVDDIDLLLSEIDKLRESGTQRCVKCHHYRFRSQETGHCREVLNWYDDTYCGCECVYEATGAETDEVQRYADAVVDAAIAWHESGQEGHANEWFDAGERLTAAIESLLSIRKTDDMPRRWCSVHNREEFKYESLEHELHARECACGAEKDAGGCPNGH